jgi:hypothetical protein
MKMRKFALSAALWFLVALPFSPSLYVLCAAGVRCSSHGVSDKLGCFFDAAALSPAAPYVLLLGPIAHNDEPPPNPYPGILGIALTLGVGIQAARSFVGRQKIST